MDYEWGREVVYILFILFFLLCFYLCVGPGILLMRVLWLFLGGGSFARARRRLIRKKGRCVFLVGEAMVIMRCGFLLFWHTFNLLFRERCLGLAMFYLRHIKQCWRFW